MIICNQCGFICPETARNCGDCGATIFNSAAGSVSSAPYASQPASAGQPYAQPGGYVPQPRPPVVVSTKTNHLLWILPVGILLVLLIAIGVTTSKRVANSSTVDTTPRPAPTVTPYPTGRLAYCKFNGVHVRASPSMDAYIITDIQQGHAVRVFRESSNYDTVFVRSLNQSVTDNWSEIQIENTSIRGWVFSGFLR